MKQYLELLQNIKDNGTWKPAARPNMPRTIGVSLKEFTESERKTISRYYRVFYNWYLVKGTPDRYALFPETLNLIKRAINFFANAV